MRAANVARIFENCFFSDIESIGHFWHLNVISDQAFDDLTLRFLGKKKDALVKPSADGPTDRVASKNVSALPTMPLFDLSACLSSGAHDRDSHASSWNDAENQQLSDRTIFSLLQMLQSHDVQRWLAVCKESAPEPIFTASLTYCCSFRWSAFFELASHHDLKVTPLTLAAVNMGFSQKPSSGDIRLSTLLATAPDATAAALMLAAIDRVPILDLNFEELVSLDTVIAAQLAWLFARDGFGTSSQKLLLSWHRRGKDDILFFWSAFSLILRLPSYHNRISDLLEWAGNDPVQTMVAESLSLAIEKGPYSPGDARQDLLNLVNGPRVLRFQRAMRLTAFLPGNAPLIDPSSFYPSQLRSANILAQKM